LPKYRLLHLRKSGQLARSSFRALCTRCVCWRAVLMEDEPGGQLALALKKRQ